MLSEKNIDLVMMVTSFSTGVKVEFVAMKCLVQFEIARRISSKLACFHKKSYGEQARDDGQVSLSLQGKYRDHLVQAFQHIA